MEQERSLLFLGKFRQLAKRTLGVGVPEHRYSNIMIYHMKTTEFGKFFFYAGVYHSNRIYRDLFTFHIETETVQVTEGLLRGRKLESVYGKPYYRFQGVPYAKPPVGSLRFRDPEPAEPWQGVRDALKEGDVCTHIDIITGQSKGAEDCLFLNIFTPELPKKDVQTDGKAVLVWIHGGGFQLGSGNAEIYGPDFFLNEDVILVTLNYRLGVLGFLSTGSEDAPGNAGLKDIVMALRWIQRNIASFGGDPNKVTIFGESAGGAAVHYLLLSPLSKGLFARAISQSGSALCPWAFALDPVETAYSLGKAFGLDTKDPKALTDYLRKVPARVLAKKQSGALSEQNKREIIPFAFLPCAEPADYPNAFITKHPAEMVEAGEIASRVPYITGINDMEGMIMLKTIMDKKPPASAIDKDFERVVPRFLKLEYGSSESKEVAKKLKDFYFQDKPFEKSTYANYCNLTTDTQFLYGMHRATQHHNQHGSAPVYNYEFTFEGEFGLFKKILNIKNIPGPAHADDIGYLFHVPLLGPNLDPKTPEIKVSKAMTRLWCNFAKCGNPTPDQQDPVLGNIVWKPRTEDQKYYLRIGEQLELKENIKDERIKFWEELTQKTF